MHVPQFAISQGFLGLGTERQHSRPHGDDAPSDAPAPSALVEPPPGVPHYAARAFTRMGAAPFVLVLFLSMAACKGGSAGSGATPPAPGPAVFSSSCCAGAVARAEPPRSPGSALASAVALGLAVDDLERRVDRLDPGAYAIPAALSAVLACDVLGVRTVAFGPGEARFACNRLGSLGTRPRLSSNRAARAKKAASVKRSDGPTGPVALNP